MPRMARKLKLKRRKNEERKRQKEKVNKVGRVSDVTRCIAIQPAPTWKAFVHGRELANSSSAL